MIRLVETLDADFAWMLGQGPGRPGLALPPGGVDCEAVLQVVRRVHRSVLDAHGRGAWMMVKDQEAVGLCSYIRPPVSGKVEIGFGVAAGRRRRGYATHAVAAMLHESAADPLVQIVTARTAAANIASQRVLEINGFRPAGTGFDAQDGEIVLWLREFA
jgi:RimJ/RimL family protein N-acetyltransferase